MTTQHTQGLKLTNPQRKLLEQIISYYNYCTEEGEIEYKRWWFIADRCDYGQLAKRAYYQLRDMGFIRSYRDTQRKQDGWYCRPDFEAIYKATGEAV